MSMSKPIATYVDNDVVAAVESAARRDGRTTSGYVRKAVEEKLARDAEAPAWRGQVPALVSAQREAQGLPRKIEDPATIARVAAIVANVLNESGE